MRAKAFAEHCIHAKAAVQYPGWRMDITEPGTAVLINITGYRRMVTFRHCRRCWDGPIMRAAKWTVPTVIWLLVMWMVSIVVMALTMGARLRKEEGESG